MVGQLTHHCSAVIKEHTPISSPAALLAMCMDASVKNLLLGLLQLSASLFILWERRRLFKHGELNLFKVVFSE